MTDIMGSGVSDLTPAEQRMAADGVSPTTHRQQSYFGFSDVRRFTFPDEITYLEYQVLDEGSRRNYLDKVASDVRIQKGSGDMLMKMQQGTQRKILMESSVCGWNFIDENGNPVSFSRQNFNKWLDHADPRLIDKIEVEIRKANPWLQADMTIEDIDEQIEQLEEMKATKIKEDEGNGS